MGLLEGEGFRGGVGLLLVNNWEFFTETVRRGQEYYRYLVDTEKPGDLASRFNTVYRTKDSLKSKTASLETVFPNLMTQH
jgi:hypothetical protein